MINKFVSLIRPVYQLALSFISLLIIYKIIHSTWGLAFIALRDSEVFAKCIGINDFKYKLMVFGLSSFLTGLIGGFYAHYVGMVSTRILGLELFLILLAMLVLGGIGRFPGAVIRTFITVFISEWLRPLGIYRLVIFGAMVILLILIIPQGITGLLFPVEGSGLFGKISRFIQQKVRARRIPHS